MIVVSHDGTDEDEQAHLRTHVFPQTVDSAPDPVFVRGEVWVPIAFDHEEAYRLGLQSTLHMADALPRIAAHHLGLPPESEAIEPPWRGLERCDVRFSPQRDRVLAAVDDPQALTMPYHELSLAHGLDPARFF